MAAPKQGALPPPPIPGRELPPPPRRPSSGTFTLDSDTPSRTVETAQLAALVSLLEFLPPKKRDRLIAIGYLMRDLSEEQIERLLDLAIAMNGLG